MDSNKMQNFMGGFNKYVKPYVNMGNARGTFGSFNSLPTWGQKNVGRKDLSDIVKKKNQKKNKKKEVLQPDKHDVGKVEKQDERRLDNMDDSEKKRAMHRLPADGMSGLPKESEKTAAALSGGAGSVKNTVDLQQAVLWSEILGDPVSRKRRKKRVNQLYGNQSNAYRG